MEQFVTMGLVKMEFVSQINMRNLLILIYLSIGLSFANTPTSESYSLACSQFSSGFKSANSENYSLRSALGTSDFSGIRASSQYVLETGCAVVQSDLAISTQRENVSNTDITLLINVMYTAIQELDGAILDVNLTGTAFSQSWQCISNQSATCTPNSGNGNVSTNIQIEPNALLQIQIEITTQDTIYSIAQITMPNGANDSNPSNNVSEFDSFEDLIFINGFE